jgi:hypothetical protein
LLAFFIPGIARRFAALHPGLMLHSASSAEKEKVKWHDEAGMTLIFGQSSLGGLLPCLPIFRG